MLDGWRRRRGGAAPELAAATDEALLVLAQGGDTAAFEMLVRRYTQPLYAFATRILGSADDAADVVQHTFIQCYNALPRLRADTALRPWFYRVARNRCLDLIRQRRTLPANLPHDTDEERGALDSIADSGPSLESLAERRDLQRLLAEAVAGLPPKYREVVVLRYEGDLTFGEIAETLGIPENSAKTLFQRAKTMLRLALREWVREQEQEQV
ncbi:MAG: sigma-70 family RNA polymerase sigma factor [Ktedonobacterales bacterium]|nr:sigma-70 family RNA polymerase sigma factor [Ktedonobacterales bacterium]